jgi:hypothetical protein
MFRPDKDGRVRAREIDQGLGLYAEKISRYIWPWNELRLLIVVTILSFFDYSSTFTLLRLSGKTGVIEAGRIAGWALDIGGFGFLLLIDIAAVAVLSVTALIARYLYTKFGFRGYGRAAFVFLLIPFIAITAFAIVNNIVLLFR